MKKLGKMYKVTEFSINNQMRFSVFYLKKPCLNDQTNETKLLKKSHLTIHTMHSIITTTLISPISTTK